MKKIYIIILTLLLPILSLWSQNSLNELVGSSGDQFTSETLIVNWSIGEVVTETYYNGSVILTQGLHQVFETQINFDVPTVVTSQPIISGLNTAIVGGVVISGGGRPVTDRGIFWGEQPNPQISGTQVSVGSGLGEFQYVLENLNAGQTYFVIAFAINSEGIAYGEELSFCMQIFPTVITFAAENVTNATATVGGEVICNGGSDIIDRGIFWGESPEPQFSGTQVSFGSGTGSFSGQLEGLDATTTYYVIAYATNIIGTAYGNEISFTTLGLPVVVTSEVTEITENSALVGGNILSDGGDNIIERGVYLGTEPDPELTGSKIAIGSGTGSYSTTISNLQPATIYFVKAFASNSLGTAFGNQEIFETLPEEVVPTDRIIDGLVLNAGEDICFSATQTITVAGNGQAVEVKAGANLHLIAGKSIHLKSGFKVYSGGNFLARIDTEGNYCENAKSILAAQDVVEENDIALHRNEPLPTLFRAYPNPTSGMLTIEVLGYLEESAEIQVYSLIGEMLVTTRFDTHQSQQIDLTRYPSGIYFIRLVSGNSFAIERIIKR